MHGRSQALKCQVTPQNKVNIGMSVSHKEVHRRNLSLAEVLLTRARAMRHLNYVQVARAVTLIQEGWTFRLLPGISICLRP